MDKVVLYHVAQSACTVLEAATLFDTEILDSGNLYIIDVITILQRFKNAIGKTESKDILCRLFTKEVVNAIDLRLFENGSIDMV